MRTPLSEHSISTRYLFTALHRWHRRYLYSKWWLHRRRDILLSEPWRIPQSLFLPAERNIFYPESATLTTAAVVYRPDFNSAHPQEPFPSDWVRVPLTFSHFTETVLKRPGQSVAFFYGPSLSQGPADPLDIAGINQTFTPALSALGGGWDRGGIKRDCMLKDGMTAKYLSPCVKCVLLRNFFYPCTHFMAVGVAMRVGERRWGVNVCVSEYPQSNFMCFLNY